jgi:hypothetical protein
MGGAARKFATGAKMISRINAGLFGSLGRSTEGAGRGWHMLLYAAAAMIALAAMPAAAQTSGSTITSTPAEKYVVNPAGVDMRTGQYTYRQTDLAIGGTDESGGLALTRSMKAPFHPVGPFGNFTHNWDIVLTEKRISVGTNNFENNSGTDYQISVRFGGRSQTFNSVPSGTGFTQVSHGAYAALTYTGDRASAGVVYTFTAADGTVATFRPLGNLDCLAGNVSRCAYVSQIAEADGTVFAFDYDYDAGAPTGVERARLRSVVSSRGYALVLEGANGMTTKACVLNLTQTVLPVNHLCPGNAPATASYTYTSFNGSRLASVTDPSNRTSSFTYAGTTTSFTMGFIKPGQSAAWLTNTVSPTADEDNGGYEAVWAQSFADGQHYSYLYEFTPLVNRRTPNHTIAGGQYTDALQHTTELHFGFREMPGAHVCKDFGPCPPRTLGDEMYQLTPGPEQIVDALSRTTTSDYCDPNELTVPPPYGGCLVDLLQSYTDPEGIKTVLTYDSNRNVMRTVRHAKPGSGLPDIVTSAVFDVAHPKSSNKPLSVTDANANTTNYTYAPEHGGVLTETLPAVNGIRPQKRYSYAQRTAWISNGAGGWMAAGPPIWVLTQMSFCKVGAAAASGVGCANGPSDEVVTTYDYGPDAGPNNLILRGTVVDAGGLSLRTCTSYDALGNKISETRPRAGLASCP